MLPSQDGAIFAERPVRIICIGAGVSGLCFAYKLSRSFRNFRFTIYEKNQEASGTWHENTYPGCTCDVPAHNYTYTFEPKHDWTSIYAGSAEIKQYYLDFCHKYQLGQYIKTSQKVTSCRWLDDKGKWLVQIQDLISQKTYEDECDILINAGGYLNHWVWPRIEGLESFSGPTIHSAAWNSTLQLKDKAVGLIGNGSSAVQILPALEPVARNVTTFFRSPNWILPSIGAEQREYTVKEIWKFAKGPNALSALRSKTEASLNSYFEVYLKDTPMQNETKTRLIDFMKMELQNETIEEALIPGFSVGCRRLTPSSSYLKALTSSRVRVVTSPIEKITSTGCRCKDGTDFALDIIICATGFDTSFKPRFPIIGRDNANLQEDWSHQPSTYMGIAAAGFPNMFSLLGPHSPIGNGPLHPCLEAQADHILKLVDRYQTEPIHSIVPKLEAVSDFMEHTARFMKGTVWMDPCSSAYKNQTREGRLPTLWPGSSLHCIEALVDVRGDDWDIRYHGNRFAWLGNGISQTELDPTSDLAYYIKETDETPFLSRRRRREVLTGSGTQPERKLHEVYRP